MKIDRYKELEKIISDTKKILNKEMVEGFPVDSIVFYTKNGKTREGIVIRHDYQDGLFVRNIHTDKSYWITLFDVFRGFE